MSTLLVAARAVHYASAMLLFGELVFVFVVAAPPGAARSTGAGADDDIRRRLQRIARWSVAASLVSGAVWLALAAAAMSGIPIEQALNPDILWLVLGNTTFGRVWMLRLGLVAALCVLLLALTRATRGDVRSRLMVGMLALAATYLATLAWTGHAAAGQGRTATSGSLPMSCTCLLPAPGSARCRDSSSCSGVRSRSRRRRARRGDSRTLSALCMALLTASGLANTWYLVGDVPALFGTDYGRLLLAKLALFAAMLVLAMANRWYLSVRLAGGDLAALHSLRRNATVEWVAGIGVVIIVGALGVTPPAAHQSPLWPFDHTLSWARVEPSAWLQMACAAAGMIACVSAGVALAGVRLRRAKQWLSGLAGVVACAAILAWLLVAPAYPTTYAASPVRYTAEAIAGGAVLYASNCSACHGHLGRGDGPAGGSLPTKPTDLTERALQHREGELFWWIAHGIPGTPMRGHAPPLSELEVWRLVQFLFAQAEARDAVAMTDRIKPLRPIAAPDFTFERPGRPQESLQQQRGDRVTLLVFYSLPESLPRLREIAASERAYAAAGARVIAVPFVPGAIAGDDGIPGNGRSILARADASVAAAYAMFARQPDGPDDPAPTHLEFLIDRQGYLRTRRIGVADATVERTKDTLDRIDVLNREPARPSALWGHAHR